MNHSAQITASKGIYAWINEVVLPQASVAVKGSIDRRKQVAKYVHSIAAVAPAKH